MIALFWGIVVLMLAVALALLVTPIVRGGGRDARHQREALNVAIHRDRLAELEAERDAGNLSEEAFEQARNELDRDLLADVEPGEETAAANAPARTGRWVGAVIAVGVPVAAVGLYWNLGAINLVDADNAPPHTPQAAGEPQAGDLEAMVGELKKRINEGDPALEDWLLLVRAQVMLRRYEAAQQTLQRARKDEGDAPDLLTEMADVTARLQDGRMSGKPTELIHKALELNPDHRHGLWLAGVAASQEGDYAGAVEYWERLLKSLPEDSQSIGVVRQSIRQAEERIAGGGLEAPAEGPAAGDAADATSVDVAVALAPEVADQAAPGDTVFIFARPSDGSRMPLAAVRTQVQELPARVTLDESSGMGGERKLSDFQQVEIIARVSKGGGVSAQSGDLEGRAAAEVGGEVKLTIDRVLP